MAFGGIPAIDIAAEKGQTFESLFHGSCGGSGAAPALHRVGDVRGLRYPTPTPSAVASPGVAGLGFARRDPALDVSTDPVENWLRTRAGIGSYQRGFLLHYLDSLVYPDVPPNLLIVVASAVCLFNLGVYAVRFRRRRVAGW